MRAKRKRDQIRADHWWTINLCNMCVRKGASWNAVVCFAGRRRDRGRTKCTLPVKEGGFRTTLIAKRRGEEYVWAGRSIQVITNARPHHTSYVGHTQLGCFTGILQHSKLNPSRGARLLQVAYDRGCTLKYLPSGSNQSQVVLIQASDKKGILR